MTVEAIAPRLDPQGPVEPKHFAYIDAMRGWAFLGVLLYHSALSVGHFPSDYLARGGNAGVQLFFLVSALTLCHSMTNRKRTEVFPILFFYLRRLFRIAPLFWLAILFYRMVSALTADRPFHFPLHYYLLTALFMNGWHPNTISAVVPGGWSIAVEMTFYLIFPLLFTYINSLRRAAAAVLLGLVFAKAGFLFLSHFHQILYRNLSSSLTSFSEYWFPSQAEVFLMGMLVYYLQRSPSLPQSRWRATGTFLFFMAILISSVKSGSAFVSSTLLVASLLAALVYIVSKGNVPGVVNPAIRYLGKISYSCYLIHFAAMTLVFRIIGIHFTSTFHSVDTGHALSNGLLFISIALLTLLITVPCATLTLHLIENPGIALGRRVISSINAWGQTTPPHSALQEAEPHDSRSSLQD